MSEKATYTHGHHSSVVNSHARRTIHDSAAFLIPHIEPHHQILDLGCGPGSITVGLASLVPNGSVIGGDSVPAVLDQARSLAASLSLTNVTFQELDGNALPFPPATFDVTYTHQVLQHVGDPVAVLRELRRVTKPGGLVAARDADYKTFAWWPETPALARWGDVYQRNHASNGAQPNAGRYLRSWAKEAGFDSADITFSWHCWHYQGEAAVAWGNTWRDRTLYSSFATGALEKGLVTQEQLGEISRAWEVFAGTEDAFIVIPNGEILCRVR